MTPAPPEALAGTTALIGELCANGVQFVQWKSTVGLANALAGHDDLDLLVRRADAGRFEEILARHGFERVGTPSTGTFPAVAQYYGVDAGTQRWIHVDAYFALTTGSSRLKEYRLPLDGALLAGEERLHGVPVPEPGAELLVLVCLQMIKRSSLLQLATRHDARSSSATRAEIEALVARDSLAPERAIALLRTELPALEPALWRTCLVALREGWGPVRCYLLGRKVRARLHAYRRIGGVAGMLAHLGALARTAGTKARGAGGGKRLARGGAVVALVGPEATGKSTLARDLASWLGGPFELTVVHFGKPPPTLLTAALALPLPLLRRAFPGHRTSVAPTSRDDPSAARQEPSWLFVLRSLVLAWDRRALARRVHGRAANGAVVVCDRYPSPHVGAMDSARLDPDAIRSGAKRRAANLERRLYRQIPRPSLVVQLTVPTEVAVERNRSRAKDRKESDAYVRHRHRHQALATFPGTPTARIDTAQDATRVGRELREIVWRHL